MGIEITGTGTLDDPYVITNTGGGSGGVEPPREITTPLTWLQFEPPTQADITTVTTAFVPVPGAIVDFVIPASGMVVVVVDMTCITPGGMGVNEMRARWHDGTNPVPDTDCAVQNSASRERHSMITIATGLIPGLATWTLQICSDGTHAAGVRVGPAYPITALVWDPDYSIIPTRLGYLIRSTGGGSAPAGEPITANVLVRQEMQGGFFIDLPPFTAPASGLVMVTMHCTAVMCTDGADDYFAGLWDINAGIAVPGSACHMSGGSGNRRNHPHYRKIISGLTPGQVYNWSFANYVSPGGSNVVGVKFGEDDTEGPMHLIITGLDI